MYNANQKKNPLIYGTVFASGTAQIKGNGKLIDFDINLKEIQEAITDIPSIIITNRAIAVEQAVEQASPGDVILLLGKGHEKFISLEVGQRDYEGDKAIALKAIKRVYEGEEENELQ